MALLTPPGYAYAPFCNVPPLAQTSSYATDCRGRHFSTRPGEALPHVGALDSPRGFRGLGLGNTALRGWASAMETFW